MVASIKNGSEVTFHYTLKVEGQVVDSSAGRDPLRYTHGSGHIVTGLESNLEGLEAGDKRDVVVQPEDGYGLPNPDAVQKVPRSAFSSTDGLNVGDVVNGESPQGQFQARVDAIDEDHVTLDLNHPLAGKTLDFQIEIVEVQ
jgi:FKBP-type peptidyl-prolyl cis-trans isomerase SlyD